MGRTSSYEVVVGDTIQMTAYSKLKTGAFPDFAALAGEIAAYAKSGAAPAAWTKS